MSLTPITNAPSRGSSPSSFAIDADNLLAVALPRLVTELNAVIPAIDAQATAAAAAATAAYASEVAAVGASNASVWVSGTTYTAGQVRWSPTTFQSFRRKTNGAGTTDPYLDSTNWVQLSTVPLMTGHAGSVMYTDGTNAYWSTDFVTAAGSYTLTNKTFALGSNTLSGTLAQFNAAVSDADLAPVNSPTFTGTPAAPTASAGTNTTQIATTAFVSTVKTSVLDEALAFALAF